MRFLSTGGLSVVLLLLSCNNSPYIDEFSEPTGIYGLGREPDPCLGVDNADYRLAILDQSTSSPAKVSIFFRVTDLAANPIDGLNDSHFSIYEQGRNDDCFSLISPTESERRTRTNPQIFKNQTLLLLDLSSSVLEESLDELKEAASSFIQEVMPDSPDGSTQMAIFGFDGQDRLIDIQALTGRKDQLLLSVEAISEQLSQDPSTDLYGSVLRITEEASMLVQQARTQSFVASASVVLFTDGRDQAARYSKDRALDVVENADSNISYYTIGLGTEIDTEVLEQIGKTFSAFASDRSELQYTFNSISDRLNSAANSYYLFEYCSPKRSGSGLNNLVVELNYDGKFGAVQTVFDANGFTSGCDPSDFE